MVLLCGHFSRGFLSRRGTDSAGANTPRRGERDPNSVWTNSTTVQTSHRSKMQPDKAYTTEQNLPTPRSASSQCNECFRQQHTFPFPQQNCLLPTGHLGLEQAAQHQPKNHSQAPKGPELLEIAVPLRMVVGRAAPPPTNGGKKKKKKKSVGRRAETRPGRDCWRNKRWFSANGDQ